MEQVMRCLPNLFQSTGTCLYIGAECDSIFLLPELWASKYKVTLLEAWGPNCLKYKNHPMIDGVINCTIQSFGVKHRWDLTVWWHGPEHIKKEDLAPTIFNIESLTGRLILLACPWGRYEEGEMHGNPFEVHRASLYEEDFRSLGYDVDVIGEKDVPGSNLMAWKHISREG